MRKSFENSSTRLAASLLAAGLGASALSGCSAVQKASYHNCLTTFVNTDGATAVRQSIVDGLNQAMTADTGKPLPDGTAYKGANDTATKIQDILIAQYAENGQSIDSSIYSLAQTNPFKSSMIRFCVGAVDVIDSSTGTYKKSAPGLIVPGKSECIMTYGNYQKVVNDKSHLQQFVETCGGPEVLPQT